MYDLLEWRFCHIPFSIVFFVNRPIPIFAIYYNKYVVLKCYIVNKLFTGSTDLKTKVLFMELRDSYDRLSEEIVILEREMRDFIIYCNSRIKKIETEQSAYSK